MLLLSALALALPAPHLSHEPLPVLAPGWRIVGAPAPTERIELTFALKQQNLDQLHDTLMAVSTPTSERYGKHLTNEAVHALVAPAAADVATVRNFLDAHEVKSATPNDDMLTVTTTFGAAERLLNAEYVTLEHTSGSRVHRAALSGYSIPANVAAAIDFVSPTVHVPGVRASAKAMVEAKADSPSFNENEPTTLRTLYSIPLATAGKAKANKMAVTAFLGQEYDQGDLKQYWSK